MAEDQLNSISCESCRSRKTKCSRILPSCAECSRLSQQCRYPPAVKRGPPTGYIVSLEQRLAETEAALFNTISKLDAATASTSPSTNTAPLTITPEQVFARLADHGGAETRASRMLDWTRLTLRTEQGQRAWWHETKHAAMVEDEPASSSSAPPPPSPGTLPSAVAAAAASGGGGGIGGIGVPQPSTSPPPRRRVSSYGRYSSTDPLIISRSSIPSPNQWASAFQLGQDQSQNQNQEYGHRHLPTSRTPDLQHQSLERGPPDPTSERSIDDDYAAAAAKRAAKRNSRGGDGGGGRGASEVVRRITSAQARKYF